MLPKPAWFVFAVAALSACLMMVQVKTKSTASTSENDIDDFDGFASGIDQLASSADIVISPDDYLFEMYKQERVNEKNNLLLKENASFSPESAYLDYILRAMNSPEASEDGRRLKVDHERKKMEVRSLNILNIVLFFLICAILIVTFDVGRNYFSLRRQRKHIAMITNMDY